MTHIVNTSEKQPKVLKYQSLLTCEDPRRSIIHRCCEIPIKGKLMVTVVFPVAHRRESFSVTGSSSESFVACVTMNM